MIWKEKNNVKRVLALILSLVCVTGLLAGCGRQNTDVENTDGSSLEEPASDTWYEIDPEAGILTVQLPAEKEGFLWDFTIDDTSLLELVTTEDTNNTFVATFRALGDGETTVSFSYAKDDVLEEIRSLNVTCKDGKVVDVSNASVMPVSGQDDPQIEEPSSDTWYEIDPEAGILTVQLPAEKEGFLWDFTIDDTSLLELVTTEDTNNTFVATFRAVGDGETTVSFSYAKDDVLEEIRSLNVTCKDGKVVGVSNASVMPVSGQDDPQIEEPSSDTWYEIDPDAGILTVRLSAEKEGFLWDFTIDDTSLLELLTTEDTNNTFVATFRALGDGETTVYFSYAQDDAMEEIRTLNVTCKDGKVVGVSDASDMPVSE